MLAGFLVSFQDDPYGTYWALHEGDNLVGRAETAVKVDVAIAHGTTSTRHATIRCNDGAIVLSDMQSTNGTFHNQQRLAPQASVQLNDGDKVRFGGYTVSVISVAGRT